MYFGLSIVSGFLHRSGGFYVGDDSDDCSDGGSLLVDGIGLDDTYPTTGKSQVSGLICDHEF